MSHLSLEPFYRIFSLCCTKWQKKLFVPDGVLAAAPRVATGIESPPHQISSRHPVLINAFCVSPPAGQTWSCSSSATTTKTGRWTPTGRPRCRSASMPRPSPSRGATTRPPTSPCTWSTCAYPAGTPSRSRSPPAAAWVHAARRSSPHISKHGGFVQHDARRSRKWLDSRSLN